MIEAAHPVLLGGSRVGTLLQRGDVARFVFVEGYWDDPARRVLGLWFEDDPRRSPQAALRLPPWFSNLLPEGPLRAWIARDQGVSIERELQLLLRIGHDLPGAVQVLPATDELVDQRLLNRAVSAGDERAGASPWKFSLAGVGLKFSMLRQGDRLTVPASGRVGDWIVKFPDATYPDVPLNEYATMSLAKAIGIDVPIMELVDRDELPNIPDVMWPGAESVGFAIERFDRPPGGMRVHIEDFAQVRGFYPDRKYDGALETVVSIAYRGHDQHALDESIRRITFNLLSGNGDAHLKNWSFIYPDGRRPTLSPAYDLVATAGYYDISRPDDFGLKFGGTKIFERIGRAQFERVGAVLGVGPSRLLDVVEETVDRFRDAWTEQAQGRFPAPSRKWISENLESISQRLVRRTGR